MESLSCTSSKIHFLKEGPGEFLFSIIIKVWSQTEVDKQFKRDLDRIFFAIEAYRKAAKENDVTYGRNRLNQRTVR